ncbi:hypothetical protein GOX01_12350 [Gluconobacter oxydans]|nr:hypothetical protein GOX01_12350 [Gluconobacter oxydans]
MGGADYLPLRITGVRHLATQVKHTLPALDCESRELFYKFSRNRLVITQGLKRNIK